MSTLTAQEVWYGYRAKLNIKYELPFYLYYIKMSDRGAVFESGNWNPTAGTGYPYSGQAFRYLSNYLNDDPVNASGNANVQASEDTAVSNLSIYVFVSGTVNPYQTSSWYQSTTTKINAGTSANVPNNQISNGQVMASGIGVSGNSLYSLTPNQNMDPIQASGSANVPKSESSTGH